MFYHNNNTIQVSSVKKTIDLWFITEMGVQILLCFFRVLISMTGKMFDQEGKCLFLFWTLPLLTHYTNTPILVMLLQMKSLAFKAMQYRILSIGKWIVFVKDQKLAMLCRCIWKVLVDSMVSLHDIDYEVKNCCTVIILTVNTQPSR